MEVVLAVRLSWIPASAGMTGVVRGTSVLVTPRKQESISLIRTNEG